MVTLSHVSDFLVSRWILVHTMMPVKGTPVHVTVGVTVIVSVLQWQLTLLNAVKEELVWHAKTRLLP